MVFNFDTCWYVVPHMQRLLVVELLSVSCKVPAVNTLHWLDELYPGEFGDLSICNLYSEETCIASLSKIG